VDRLMMQHGASGPSFTTNVWQMGPAESRSVAIKSSRRPLEHGNSLCFDFGCVFEEYCYDFGRAAFLGEPSAEYRKAYDVVMASARERMCFTVEPSIFIPGQFGARTEDVFVVGRQSADVLSHFRRDLQVVE
jgi:Xaa-Pro aminopeptidase